MFDASADVPALELDLDGFAEVLADDVVLRAPSGVNGEGKPQVMLEQLGLTPTLAPAI